MVVKFKKELLNDGRDIRYFTKKQEGTEYDLVIKFDTGWIIEVVKSNPTQKPFEGVRNDY